jgi:hypothetical protein
LKEKEYYREQIVKMIQKIEDADVLNYIYIIVDDIEKELKVKGKI